MPSFYRWTILDAYLLMQELDTYLLVHLHPSLSLSNFIYTHNTQNVFIPYLNLPNLYIYNIYITYTHIYIYTYITYISTPSRSFRCHGDVGLTAGAGPRPSPALWPLAAAVRWRDSEMGIIQVAKPYVSMVQNMYQCINGGMSHLFMVGLWHWVYHISNNDIGLDLKMLG